MQPSDASSASCLKRFKHWFALHRFRLTCALAVSIASLGMAGQLVHRINFLSPSWDAWSFHIARLLHDWHSGQADIASWFHTQGDVFPGLGMAWVMIGHAMNLGWWDVSWQIVWQSLWRAIMLGGVVWVLTSRQRRLETWLISLAAMTAAILPGDWASMLHPSGPGQWMAILAGVLAARAWVSTPDRWSNKRGWLWYIIGLTCSPTIAPLAIVAGLTQWRKVASEPPADIRIATHVKQHAAVMAVAGALLALACWIFWPGESQADDAGVLQAIATFFGLMSYPFIHLPWLGVVAWLPWLVLAVSMKQRQADHAQPVNDERHWLVLTLGGWVLLLFVVAAWQGRPPNQPSHWQNTAALPLGMLVNVAALMLLVSPSRWKREALTTLDVIRPTSTLTKQWLLMGWVLFLALGLWQSSRSDTGSREGLQRAARTGQMISLQTQHYLSTGDQGHLQPIAQTISPAATARLQALLDDPAKRALLPRTILPPLRFSQYQSAGNITLPERDQWNLFTQDQPLGMIKPESGHWPAAGLGLLYELPEGVHWLLLQTRTQTVFPEGFELRIVDGQQPLQLIDKDHPLPRDGLLTRSMVLTPWPEIFAFPTEHRRLEIHLRTPAIFAPAGMVVYSPLPIGPMRWLMVHLLPWAIVLQAAGMTLLLILGSWRWLARRAAETRNQRWFTWRLALPATILGAAIILLVRKPHALLTPQFWAEDGTIFFADHFHQGWLAILEPYQGYFHLLPRLIAFLAGSVLPYVSLPTAYNYAAGIVTLIVIATFFSPRLPFSLSQKCMLGLSMVLVVQYVGEIYLTPTNLQWMTAALLIFTLFKQPPDASRGNVPLQWLVDVGLLMLAGLTGPFVILAMPAAVIMQLVRRNGHMLVMTGVMSLCATVQGLALLGHASTPPDPVTTHPLSWVIPQVISQRLVKDLLEPGLTDFYIWPWVNCVVLGLAFAWLGHVAWRNRKLRAMLAVFVLFMVIALLAGMWRYKQGLLFFVMLSASRYFYLPMIMLIACFITALGSQVRWHRRLAAALLSLALCATLLNSFVSRPWQDLNWSAAAAQIELHPDQQHSIPVHPVSLDLQIRLNPTDEHAGPASLDDAQRQATQSQAGLSQDRREKPPEPPASSASD